LIWLGVFTKIEIPAVLLAEFDSVVKVDFVIGKIYTDCPSRPFDYWVGEYIEERYLE